MVAKTPSKKLSKAASVVQDASFDGKKMFKTAIMCVRFLVRLLHIRTTPELLSLKQTRKDPYVMRSYRKSIDKVCKPSGARG